MSILRIFKNITDLITEKSEYSQALARVVVMTILSVYFIIKQYDEALLTIALSYTALSLIWSVWTKFVPHINWRTYATSIMDQGTITFALWLAGPHHIGIFLLYFWVIIGCGYRFGSKSELFSGAVGFVNLVILIPFAESWQHCINNMGEILIGYTLVTLFTYRLISNLENEVERANSAETRAEKFEHESLKDGLTHLCNRIYAERWMRRKQRSNTRVGVLFLDLDNFKQFNDNYGHHVGDQVLINISKRLNNCIRANDIVCRYAGDEFIILIDDENTDTITEIGGRITQALNESVQIESGERLTVTGSIGVAILGIHGNTPSETLRNADQAMYIAKRAGRNRMAWFEEKIKI